MLWVISKTIFWGENGFWESFQLLLILTDRKINKNTCGKLLQPLVLTKKSLDICGSL
jgi:hypothetical protein